MAKKTIRTRRLLLRPLTTEDAGPIAALAGDWDVARMTSRVPYPYSISQANHWIDDLADGEVVWGVTFQGELIGVCGYLRAEDGSAEIGYWIGKPWWGRGYATEAARALIGHCFGKVRMKRLICGHFIDNPASARVIEKLGFRQLGHYSAWCEARRGEAEAVRYELERPSVAHWWRRAA